MRKLLAGLILLMLVSLPLSANGAHYVTLTWTLSSTVPLSGVTISYNIYRSAKSGTETGPPINSSLTAPGCTSTSSLSNSCTYQDNNVTSGQTYYYTVSAVMGGQESVMSNEASATIPNPPAAPTGLAVIAH